MNKIVMIVVCLLLTLSLEELMLIILKKNKYILPSFLINILTNLSLNGLMTLFDINNNLRVYISFIIISEVIIVFIEAFLYGIIENKFLKNLKISFLCNLFSYVIGTGIILLLEVIL